MIPGVFAADGRQRERELGRGCFWQPPVFRSLRTPNEFKGKCVRGYRVICVRSRARWGPGSRIRATVSRKPQRAQRRQRKNCALCGDYATVIVYACAPCFLGFQGAIYLSAPWYSVPSLQSDLGRRAVLQGEMRGRLVYENRIARLAAATAVALLIVAIATALEPQPVLSPGYVALRPAELVPAQV